MERALLMVETMGNALFCMEKGRSAAKVNQYHPLEWKKYALRL